MLYFVGYGASPGYPPQMGYPPHGGGYPGGFGGPPGPPPGADPTLWNWFVTVDRDRSGQITADELQQALLNGNWSHFNSETCRLMIGNLLFLLFLDKIRLCTEVCMLTIFLLDSTVTEPCQSLIRCNPVWTGTCCSSLLKINQPIPLHPSHKLLPHASDHLFL